MKLTLKSVELVEENNQFYLDGTWTKENDGIVSEIHIPRIEIPFMRMDVNDNDAIHPYGGFSVSTCCYDGYNQEVCVNFGKGDLPLKKTGAGHNGEDVFYVEQYLEREMTVEEIEKALGHPVKIVGEERTDE